MERVVNAKYATIDYMGKEVATLAQRTPANSKLVLVSAAIVGEQVEYAGFDFVRDCTDIKVDYYLDGPVFHSALIPPRVRTANLNYTINPHTHTLYILFQREYQLLADTMQNKNISPVCQFPLNLSSMIFRLNGIKIIFQDGLSFLGGQVGSPAYNSKDAVLYYNYLRDQNIIDRPFEDMFPFNEETEAFQQAICLNIAPFLNTQNPDAREMKFTVELVFLTSESPANTNLVCVAVNEFNIHRSRKGKWEKFAL